MRRSALAFATFALAACGSDSSSEGSKSRDASADATAIDAGVDASACGNGVVEESEECDDGEPQGVGCKSDCTAFCSDATDCDDGQPCNGPETCEAAGTGRVCAKGAPPANGATCPTGNCKDGTCTPPVCGDGLVGAGEQCDDGNLVKLDGCDGGCRYEAVVRLDNFTISNGPSAPFCAHPANTYGSALSNELAAGLSNTMNAATSGGLNNLMVTFDDLDDLTGADDTSVDLRLLTGTVDERSAWTPGSFDGWFFAGPNTVDVAGNSIAAFGTGAIKAHEISAGTADFPLRVVFNFTPYDLFSRDTRFKATIDATPAPNQPAPPPAKLAPGFEIFQSLTATGTDQGLCGALTVETLAKSAVPEELTQGQTACNPLCSDSYSYVYCGFGQPVGPTCHSFLDMLVGGCKVTALCVPAIKPTQPDVGSNGNPPELLVSGVNHKVAIKTPTDAYSYHVRFTGKRAHVTNNLE